LALKIIRFGCNDYFLAFVSQKLLPDALTEAKLNQKFLA
jgi:hypothetical protein